MGRDGPVDPWLWGINLFLVVLIFLFPLGLLLFSLHRAARRRREIEAVARQQGWRYQEGDEFGLADRVEGLSVCRPGSRRLVRHVVELDSPEEAFLFDLLASDGPPRPGVGFRSQTLLWYSADEPFHPQGPSRSTTRLPGLAQGNAWVDRCGRVGVYYIDDVLVRPTDLARFAREGLAALLAENRASEPLAGPMEDLDDEES